MPSSSDDRDERVQVIAQNLRVDAATAEVLQALDRAGVQARLLKGPTLARWLYDQENPRSYGDSDLLVAPADVTAVGAILESLGFSQRLDAARMPHWWREHASEWWREEDAALVDLHRTLAGLGVDDDTAWRVLSAEHDELLVAGQPARCLALPARTLHVILHAAQHGAGWARPDEDLRRLLARCDEDLLGQAAKLAARLGATDAFAAGLRLAPEGRAVAAQLGLPGTSSVEASLRAGDAPRQALSFERLQRAKSTRARMAFIWSKFVPPVAFMRHWWPPAAQGRRALVAAYVWHRPRWLLRTAPSAFRAWRRAHREMRD
jgi:hypothetical protein